MSEAYDQDWVVFYMSGRDGSGAILRASRSLDSGDVLIEIGSATDSARVIVSAEEGQRFVEAWRQK